MMWTVSLAWTLLSCGGPSASPPPGAGDALDSADTDVPDTDDRDSGDTGDGIELPGYGRWLSDMVDGEFLAPEDIIAELSATGMGDMDGDGLAEVRVDARLSCIDACYDEGMIWVVTGPASGPSVSAASAGPFFHSTDIGKNRIFDGDLSGDGRAELLIAGRLGDAPPESMEPDTPWGLAFHWPLSGPLALNEADQAFQSDGWLQPGGWYDGQYYSGNVYVRDLDGDGHDDLLVGRPASTILIPGPFGSVTNTDGVAARFIASTEMNPVAAPADLNGDGTPDLLFLGAADPQAGYARQLYLVDGTLRGEQQVEDVAWAKIGSPGPNHIPLTVVVLGDINGDGHADLAIGDQRAHNHRGVARVLLGPFDGTHDAADESHATFRPLPDGASTRLLDSGDFDGDGVQDLLVAVAALPSAPDASARVLLFRGQSLVDELTEEDATVALYAEQGVYLDGGANVGDLNGDGIDDFAIWSRAAAKVYFVYGRSSW